MGKKKNTPADIASEADLDTPPDLDLASLGEDDDTTTDTSSENPSPEFPDPEIARVAKALKQPEIEAATDEDDELPPPVEIPSRRARKKFAAHHTHVVTEVAGEIRHNGTSYKVGEPMTLAPHEAAQLGNHVERIER